MQLVGSIRTRKINIKAFSRVNLLGTRTIRTGRVNLLGARTVGFSRVNSLGASIVRSGRINLLGTGIIRFGKSRLLISIFKALSQLIINSKNK